MNNYGHPGIGGGLGQCALCGESFIKEMLLSKSFAEITSDGFEGTLYAHKECLTKYGEKLDLNKLPDKSPLKEAYLKQCEELDECPECRVSLNKDGKCPSCEQDHADYLDEANHD